MYFLKQKIYFQAISLSLVVLAVLELLSNVLNKDPLFPVYPVHWLSPAIKIITFVSFCYFIDKYSKQFTFQLFVLGIPSIHCQFVPPKCSLLIWAYIPLYTFLRFVQYCQF